MYMKELFNSKVLKSLFGVEHNLTMSEKIYILLFFPVDVRLSDTLNELLEELYLKRKEIRLRKNKKGTVCNCFECREEKKILNSILRKIDIKKLYSTQQKMEIL